VAGGGDIIVILSSRVLGVWGTGRLGDEITGIRIIFGLGGLKGFEVVDCYLKNVWFLKECLDIDKRGQELENLEMLCLKIGLIYLSLRLIIL